VVVEEVEAEEEEEEEEATAAAAGAAGGGAGLRARLEPRMTTAGCGGAGGASRPSAASAGVCVASTVRCSSALCVDACSRE
jgi:hypothetical protein